MSRETLDLLQNRRSVKPAAMVEPGPSATELDQILTVAARVPDHKKLAPWRFIVFQGAARAEFGRVLVKACLSEEKTTPSALRLEAEATRFTRAPTVVAVISRVDRAAPAPEWEQVLSAGAACFNLCLAANALGFGTSWLTEWYSYSPAVHAALGLAGNERVAGFIYIGTPKERQADRERPRLSDIVSHWKP